MGTVDVISLPSVTNSAAKEENCFVGADLQNYATIKGKLGSGSADQTFKGDLHDSYYISFAGNSGNTIGKNLNTTLRMGIGQITVYGYCQIKASYLPCSDADPNSGKRWVLVGVYRPGKELFDELNTKIRVGVEGSCDVPPICPQIAIKKPKASPPNDPTSLKFIPTLGIKQIGKSSTYTILLRP